VSQGRDRCGGCSGPLPIGDEPVDRHRRKARGRDWFAGMRAVWTDAAGCLEDRRIIEPSTQARVDGNPVEPAEAKRTPPPRARGRLLQRRSRREGGARSQHPSCPPCPTPRREFPLRSSAEVPISAVTACASRYRSHSSFVDGRDARLVMGRLPSVDDERSARHASASSAAAGPRGARQGRMVCWTLREEGPRDAFRPNSSPHHRARSSKGDRARTSGPSCTWSKRRSRP
jgi:hypothetical protein